MVPKMSPGATHLNFMDIPGKITKGVYSKALPANTCGVIERTVRKVPTAPKTDQVSLKFGFLGVNIISREATEAIKTANMGRMEIMVSIVSMGIKNLSFQFTDSIRFNRSKSTIDRDNDT